MRGRGGLRSRKYNFYPRVRHITFTHFVGTFERLNALIKNIQRMKIVRAIYRTLFNNRLVNYTRILFSCFHRS